MAEIIVVNVVASASIGKELMLQDIAFQLEGAEYDQDRLLVQDQFPMCM